MQQKDKNKKETISMCEQRVNQTQEAAAVVTDLIVS